MARDAEGNFPCVFALNANSTFRYPLSCDDDGVAA